MLPKGVRDGDTVPALLNIHIWAKHAPSSPATNSRGRVCCLANDCCSMCSMAGSRSNWRSRRKGIMRFQISIRDLMLWVLYVAAIAALYKMALFAMDSKGFGQ
jgi:hypothetical protein